MVLSKGVSIADILFVLKYIIYFIYFYVIISDATIVILGGNDNFSDINKGKYKMRYIICKECGFDNDEAAKYCQRCGSHLTQKKNFKKFIESLNFGSVAGAGAKGTSIAPIAGMKIDNNSDNRDAMVERVRKSYSLEDGS